MSKVQTFDPTKAPLISETLLKKRRTLDELQHKRATVVQQQQKKRRVVRGEDIKIKRPEQFLKENKIKTGSLKKMQRRAKETERRSHVKLPKGMKIKETIGFVVRIHEGKFTNSEIKKYMNSIGLKKKYEAVFMKLDEKAIEKLKPYDAYVAYGYISNKNVEELVHRRSYILVDGAKSPLSNNMCVEKALGDKGLICLSDVSHEIYNVGSTYEECLKLLCTYQLSSPTGAYEKKVLNVHDEVEHQGGFLGDAMEDFLNKIL